MTRAGTFQQNYIAAPNNNVVPNSQHLSQDLDGDAYVTQNSNQLQSNHNSQTAAKSQKTRTSMGVGNTNNKNNLFLTAANPNGGVSIM